MGEYKIKYKSNRNVVYSCKYNVIWCPKYRRKVITGLVETRLKQIIEDVCTECQSEIFELETQPDHVHLLVEVDPQFGIHKLVKRIKGRSSRVLRKEFASLRSRIPTLWTNSYFLSTIGGAPLAIVKQYIRQQKHV